MTILLRVNTLLGYLAFASSSAVNLILNSKPVNWKAITGGYQFIEFCVQVQHLSLIMSVFNSNIYTGAHKIHCEDLKL